jgi:hypothetical protein
MGDGWFETERVGNWASNIERVESNSPSSSKIPTTRRRMTVSPSSRPKCGGRILAAVIRCQSELWTKGGYPTLVFQGGADIPLEKISETKLIRFLNFRPP